MAPKSPLCKSHRQWADSKMRSLLEAHYEDARRGGSGKSYSDLVDYYMEEYEKMPFAKADFVEYLDANGKSLYKEGKLRKMARRYFHNHSDPNKLATLEAFERAGGQSEPHPERALCASEIWAAGEKDRIQALTCAELQIPHDTPAAKRPDGWLGARKKVVKREFSMLPEADQARWEEEAQLQKASGKTRRVHPIAVQQRQKQFFGELSNFIKKRMARGGLGEHFVVVYQGFFVDPVAHRLSRFRGQQESFDVPKWHLSPGYDTSYKHWINYIEPLVKGRVSKDVDELPDGAVGTELLSYRTKLCEYFELLFILACGLQGTLDSAMFWAEVLDDPGDFVDPARLPPGTRFKKPVDMPEHDFVLIYRHIYDCYWNPEAVDDDRRFIYEHSAIHRYAAAERARLLQATTIAQAAAASAEDTASSASAGGTPPIGTLPAGTSAAGTNTSYKSVDGAAVSAAPGGTSADGAPTGAAASNGGARPRGGRRNTLPVGTSADGAAAGAAPPGGTLADDAPMGTASTGATASNDGARSRGRKRKNAPNEGEVEDQPTMAQERYVTRFMDERRSPPPKKQKVVKERTSAPKPKPKARGKAAAPKSSRTKGK